MAAINEMTLDEVKQNIGSYAYGLIYRISDMRFDKCEHIDADYLDSDEILEARLFSENGELHIFRQDDDLICKEFKETGDEDYIERRYELEKKYKTLGNNLIVREYVKYDDDGQAYIVLTRLAGIV